MKVQNNQILKRRIAAMSIILIITAGIELLFNYRALKTGYRPIDLTQQVEIETEGEEGSKEKYIVSYENEEGIYVQQLKLDGTFNSQYSYSVVTTGYNSFGVEKERYIYDTVNSWFPSFYTKINDKVYSLRIALTKEKDTELTSVFLLNQPEINKYRILFFLILLTLSYCIFFEKDFIQYAERFFLVFSVSFGLLTIICTQSARVSWDEQIHFRNVYKVAYGKNIHWTEAAYDIKNASLASCNTKAEYAQLRACLDERGDEFLYTEVTETPVVSYANLAYIPQALFFRLSLFLGMPFSMAYSMGKIGNLLLYIIVMYLAIREAKSRKLLLAFFAMMPTVLFQATSYTYDNVVTCFLTLGCVLWMNEMLYPKGKHSLRNVIAALLLFVVGSLSKAVYIPVVLLLVLLPAFRIKGNKKKLLLWMGVGIIFLLVMMTFVLPAITNTVAGNLSFGGDSRGGDTSTVRQLISMFHHPLASVRLMLVNMFSFDNFRNLGTAAADHYFFGNLMFLNLASLGILKDKWGILLITVFVILLFWKEGAGENERYLSLSAKFWVGTIVFMIVGLIWMALYLSFTPIGEETIAGVQARYYLPLIYLMAGLLHTNRINVCISKKLMVRISWLTVLVLEAVLFYNKVLLGRLF